MIPAACSASRTPVALPAFALRFRLLALLCCALVFAACGGEEAPADTEPGAPDTSAVAFPDTSDLDAVAHHILLAQTDARPTRALALHFPDLTRDRAYDIQQITLRTREASGNRQIGWKMGGTRVTDPEAAPDPLFGYSLDMHRRRSGQAFPAEQFVGSAPQAEAELAFIFNKDLPGPTVTRAQLLEALAGVRGAIELISPRLLPAAESDPETLTLAHAVADNLSHAGVVLGDTLVPLSAIDLEEETARIFVNGRQKASGQARDLMGAQGDAVDALLWLANELPKHGLHLRKGDFVITGSLYANPTLQPGDRAEVVFTSLDTVRVALTE